MHVAIPAHALGEEIRPPRIVFRIPRCLASFSSMDTIDYNTFESVEMRVGRITEVQDFPEARKPAYKLTIDFGSEIGVKKSSAQITKHYSKEDLQNRLVACVVNFEPKQIGPFISECLTCGVADENGEIVLISFDRDDLPLGSKVF